MRVLVALFIMTVLTGCVMVAVLPTLDDEALGQVRIGETTRVEAAAVLGQPAAISMNRTSEGVSETWFYRYGKPPSRWLFVPVIGFFVGLCCNSGSDEDRRVAVKFRPDGIVSAITPDAQKDQTQEPSRDASQ
jgi:outer membrane protein assembly factor BamE (lipoprotein component of BamABCDE complex)